MKQNRTIFNWIGVLVLFVFAISAQAQTQIGEITTASTSCSLTFDVCDGDTITLQPTNTTDYTNFQWYFGSISVANEVNAIDLSQNVVSFSGDTIRIVAPGGTYILTGEFAASPGCVAINDTLAFNFNPLPMLATSPDTLCSAAGGMVDLTTTVTDDNAATTGAGVMAWYPTLVDAVAETNAMASTTVSPAMDTKYYVRKNAAGAGGCYDIDSVQIVNSCMNLGNMVWYDTNNNGTIDAGETPIDDVIVNLFLDANNDGMISGAEETPVATDTTAAGGLYLFEGLAQGAYFVGIPSTEFGAGEPLEHLSSSQASRATDGTISETTAASADGASDTDDNGTALTAGFYSGGVMTDAVTLTYLTEPTAENPDNSTLAEDSNDNLTIDFGFYGMSIGSMVFTDAGNDGLLTSGTDAGIANVTVNLYSGDGNTLLATTTTDAGGKYLFVNLPEGDYIVAVDTSSAALNGYESSGDIATSSTPSSTDSDDNGVVFTTMDVRSNVITLDAGAAPTGEADQADAATGLGNPSISQNAATPDNNSDMQIDFGFKIDCPTITNPTATITMCAGADPGDLTVTTSQNTGIRFVMFTTSQFGAAMYTGGTDLETVVPTGAGPAYTATHDADTASFPNAGTTQLTYYVYAILSPTPADATCRPVQTIIVNVDPLPTATAASLTACEATTGAGTADFTLSGADATVLNGQTATVTYHSTLGDAQTAMNAITTVTGATNASQVFARVQTTAGCYATSIVTLNVNLAPQFSLTNPATCPGNNPEVVLTLGTNADADPQVTVNAETAVAFSSFGGANLTTTDGINPGASNSVTLTNANTCMHTETLVVPSLNPNVCLPVQIVRN